MVQYVLFNQPPVPQLSFNTVLHFSPKQFTILRSGFQVQYAHKDLRYVLAAVVYR